MTTLWVLYEYPRWELIHRYETRYIINVLRERSYFLNTSHTASSEMPTAPGNGLRVKPFQDQTLFPHIKSTDAMHSVPNGPLK